jgi:hypothetical protein
MWLETLWLKVLNKKKLIINDKAILSGRWGKKTNQ